MYVSYETTATDGAYYQPTGHQCDSSCKAEQDTPAEPAEWASAPAVTVLSATETPVADRRSALVRASARGPPWGECR